MRLAYLVPVGLLFAFAMAPADANHGPIFTVLAADGDFFYDSDGDCVGDSDVALGGEALHQQQVAAPFIGPEPLGEFGCLGGPRTWTMVVPTGHHWHLDGTVRYTWDGNEPVGGLNDVHVHVTNAQGQILVSTLLTEGPKPAIPGQEPVGIHTLAYLQFSTGTVTITEDVFSGANTIWASNLLFTVI